MKSRKKKIKKIGGKRLHTLAAEDTGLVPGQGTKIPQAVWHGQSKKKY